MLDPQEAPVVQSQDGDEGHRCRRSTSARGVLVAKRSTATSGVVKLLEDAAEQLGWRLELGPRGRAHPGAARRRARPRRSRSTRASSPRPPDAYLLLQQARRCSNTRTTARSATSASTTCSTPHRGSTSAPLHDAPPAARRPPHARRATRPGRYLRPRHRRPAAGRLRRPATAPPPDGPSSRPPPGGRRSSTPAAASTRGSTRSSCKDVKLGTDVDRLPRRRDRPRGCTATWPDRSTGSSTRCRSRHLHRRTGAPGLPRRRHRDLAGGAVRGPDRGVRPGRRAHARSPSWPSATAQGDGGSRRSTC